MREPVDPMEGRNEKSEERNTDEEVKTDERRGKEWNGEGQQKRVTRGVMGGKREHDVWRVKLTPAAPSSVLARLLIFGSSGSFNDRFSPTGWHGQCCVCIRQSCLVLEIWILGNSPRPVAFNLRCTDLHI